MADFAEQLQQDAQGEKAEISQEIAEQKAVSDNARAQLEAKLADRQGEFADLKSKQAELGTVEPPKLAPPPKAPNTQEMLRPTSLQKQFGLASVFALLSVGLAKGSAIYGLKALGGFMEGAHASNVEQAKAALEDFNSNMRQVHEANETALQEYNAIWQNKKLNFDAQERAFKLKALEFNDQLAIEQHTQGGMNAVHKLNQDRANVDKAMHTELLRNEQIKNQMARFAGQTGGADTILGISKADIPMAEPGQKNEAFLQMLSPFDQNIVKRIASGDMTAKDFGGFGAAASARRYQYEAAAATYDPNFTGQLYGVKEKTEKEFTPGGRVGTNILAIKTLPHHIDDYATDFKKLNNSQLVRWNAAKNKLATEFGDPVLNQVKKDLMLVATETAKIVKGGNASPTTEEIEHWREVYNANASPDQTKQVLWGTLKAMGGRLEEVEKSYRQQTGKDFGIIDPDLRELIIKHKPQNEPTPKWLGGGGDKVGHITEKDMDKEQERQSREFQKLGIPIARNPKTGERQMFKDGKWQPIQ